MLAEEFIDEGTARTARASLLLVVPREAAQFVKADYFVEEVRRELIARYGEQDLYEGGLSVRTTLDPRLQTIAEDVLRAGLIAYDQRHGWRGPVASVAFDAQWLGRLRDVTPPAAIGDWLMALVPSGGRQRV